MPEERAPPEREEEHTLHLRRAWGHRYRAGQLRQVLAELCIGIYSGAGYTLEHVHVHLHVPQMVHVTQMVQVQCR